MLFCITAPSSNVPSWSRFLLYCMSEVPSVMFPGCVKNGWRLYIQPAECEGAEAYDRPSAPRGSGERWGTHPPTWPLTSLRDNPRHGAAGERKIKHKRMRRVSYKLNLGCRMVANRKERNTKHKYIIYIENTTIRIFLERYFS